MLEIVWGNDWATGQRAVQFGDEIGTHMDDIVDYHRPSQGDGVDGMLFEETDCHVNMPLPSYNQSEST